MNIIYKKRGKGKTFDLIMNSALSGHVIVCAGFHNKQYIINSALQLGLTVPEPITIGEFLNNRHEGRHIEGYLIDDAEYILNAIFKGKVNSITISDEN